MSWINGPLAGTDTETTSVDVETAGIVTACVGLVRPPGSWSSATYLIAVDQPIPEAATEIHGITTEHAQQHGQPAADVLELVDQRLQAVWAEGTPVIAYNAVFDLTLIDREMRRHLGRPLIISGPVVDPLVIDKHVDRFRRGSRKLIDTCAHYGITLDNAHSADADCHAAARLAWVLGAKHGLAEMNLQVLHDAQIDWYAEQRQSFHNYLRRKGEKPDNDSLDWPLIPYVDEKVHA